MVVASSQSAMGEGLYRCSRDGEQTPGMRPEARSARRVGDPRVCGGPLEMLRTPERVSNPQNAYGMSKYGEEMVALNLGRRYGIPTVALRYSIVQGPRQSVYNAYSGACRIFSLHYLLGSAPTLYEDGEMVRDYVNIHDVVDANLLVLDDPGRRPGFQRRRRDPLHHKGVRRDRPGPLRVRPSGPGHGQYRFGDTRHISRRLRARGPGVGPATDPGRVGRRVRRLAEGDAGSRRGARRRGRHDAVPRRGPGVERMKAFLLAAGLGTAAPSPDTCPSASSGWGPPLLDLWLDNFRAAGVDEVLVNLHHLPEQVRSHLAAAGGRARVRTSYEPVLLGSAGTSSPAASSSGRTRCSSPSTATTSPTST